MKQDDAVRDKLWATIECRFATLTAHRNVAMRAGENAVNSAIPS